MGEFVIRCHRRTFSVLALAAVALLASARPSAQTSTDHKKKSFSFPGTVPVPANNKLTPTRVKLGEMLFFDPRLSAPIGSAARPVTIRAWGGPTASPPHSAMA